MGTAETEQLEGVTHYCIVFADKEEHTNITPQQKQPPSGEVQLE
jgi:hypothetical protein